MTTLRLATDLRNEWMVYNIPKGEPLLPEELRTHIDAVLARAQQVLQEEDHGVSSHSG